MSIDTESRIELSLIVPLLNESEVFARTIERLQSTMDSADFSCESILIDDGSSDGTRALIEQVCRIDNRFRGVLLSRNFGHQPAVSAGLDYATGRTIAILDGDLQDPPELLLDFHRKLNEGFDVVYAVRRNRKENALKRLCYWAFYRLLRKLSAVDIPLDSGDFCLMSRKVVDHIRAMPERHRFIRGMRSWIGFRQTSIEYDRATRQAGVSKYTISKLMLLALDGLLTFSEIPLRLSTLCGATVAAASMLWGVYILGWRVLGGGESIPGFATMACGMFFLGGVQLICLGILGEYIARIHNQVKGRPIYIVDRVITGRVAQPKANEDMLESQIHSELQNLLQVTEPTTSPSITAAPS